MSEGRAYYKLWMVWTAVTLVEGLFWLFVGSAWLFGASVLPTLRYHDPRYAWFLVALPLYSLVFMYSVWRKNRTLKKFADAPLIPEILPGLSTTRAVLKYVLVRMGAGFLVIGLIGPKLGSRMEEIKSKGIDIFVALDVSNSMLAEDVKPNRLERAKMSVEQMLEKLHGDRLGIVVFAGNAFVQLPITNDYSAARMFSQTIDTHSVTEQGTAIGNAIRMCAESFDPVSPAQKVIVVVTDGENHEDDAVTAAKDVYTKQGISVYTLGIGTVEGTVLPVYSDGKKTGFREDNNGQPIVSVLDESMLAEIADAGGGTFTRVVNTYSGLSDIVKELSKKEKTELATKEFADYEHRYGWFVACGLALLLFDLLLASRKGTWTSYLNLFES